MLDLLIVLAFIVYALGAGLRARRKASENLQEYFLAGRTVPGWKAGLSMAATQFAADTPLLVTGLVATAGVFALWRLWIYGLAFLLLAFVFAVNWRRGGVLTDAELTETRYSGRGVLALRVLKALYYGTVINCVVMAMVLVAAIRIAEVFLPWHEWLPAGAHGTFVSLGTAVGLQLGGVTGLAPELATANNLISILIILLFTAMYSTTGGLRAVINTDVMQFLLAMVGTALYAWYVAGAVGGLGNLSARLVELYGAEHTRTMLSFGPPDWTAAVAGPFLVLIGLQWFFQMNSDGTGYLAQRSMACRSDRDARLAGIIFTWVQIFLRSLFWLVIAAGLLALYPFSTGEMGTDGFVASRELLFVTGINDLLPPGVRGVMLVGLLAALASTVDTHLNWGASYWSNDVYDRLVSQHWLKREPSGRELVIVARLSNLLILTIAIAIMANLGSIQAAWFISLLFGAGMGSVLVLRWLWERINLYSELAAMAASLVTAPLLLAALGVDPGTEWVRLGVMAAVTTAVAIGITFVTPRTDEHVLLAFYERVRPFGFWAVTARRAGDRPEAPRQELARRSRFAGLTAASLFLGLFGVGRVVLSPPDAWPAVTWGAIFAAVALVPAWWRGLRREDLGVVRSALAQDTEAAERRLLDDPDGLLAALRHLATHMKVVYGMNLEVVGRGEHRVLNHGQRFTLFWVVQDLLLFLARRQEQCGVRVVVEGDAARNVVLVEPEVAFDFGPAPRRAARAAEGRARPSDFDVLLRASEHLYQVGGRLRVEPDRREARRIELSAPVHAAEERQGRGRAA